MKKHIFSFFICANIFCAANILSCPYSFSPEDQRPFFEQYETENKTTLPEKKEPKA